MPLRRRSAAVFAPALLALAGCLSTPAGRDDPAAVLNEVRDRAGRPFVPATVDLGDGLAEGEAVQLALWNNAAYGELLTDLGLAHADVVQAGLLPNPEFQYILPAADKPFRYLFDLQAEALWLRPARVRAASAEWDRARERLVQAGLDLMRDTRLAYADWALAVERVRIADENRRLRERLLALTEERLRAGDATPLEVSTARIDATRAVQEATRAGNYLPIFEERLRNLTGLGVARYNLTPQAPDPPALPPAVVGALAAVEFGTRPDVKPS
jgi:cobalt-zinc-cadmium efflux system outer membrane protein